MRYAQPERIACRFRVAGTSVLSLGKSHADVGDAWRLGMEEPNVPLASFDPPVPQVAGWIACLGKMPPPDSSLERLHQVHAARFRGMRSAIAKSITRDNSLGENRRHD